MKLGIVGAGMIVHDLNQIMNELPFDKIAIFSLNKDDVENIIHDEYFDDYDKMLESDVDVIYIALPNVLHYNFTKKALLHHKHVICEKPITSNYQEFKKLKDLAFENNVYLFEAMTIPHMPAFQKLKEYILKLGRIRIVSLNYSQYSSRYDKFKKGEILPAFDYHKSGGALYDLNVYNIHFLTHLFGKPKAVHYYPNVEKGIDTSGICVLEYDDFVAQSIGAKDCSAPLMNMIQSDDGTLQVNMPVSRMTSFVYRKNNGEEEEITYDNKHAMSYEFNEFVRIILNKDDKAFISLLEVSEIVSQILTEARKQGGIYFDADKN